MRSRTSTTGPTSTTSPVSSRTSRATADSSVSPSSTAPPGRLHAPLSGSCPRFTSTTRGPSSTTAPTPTIGRSGKVRTLHAHHLHDDTLLASAIELGVEDLLPRAEVELALGDRHHHLVSHDRALQMRVGVVLAGLVMAVRQSRRRELLEPDLEILDEPVLPVIHVHARGDVHRRHKHHPLGD